MALRLPLCGTLVAVAMAVAMAVMMANGSSGDSNVRGHISEAGRGNNSVWQQQSEGVHG